MKSKATVTMIKSSVQKVNEVADLIRGRTSDDALYQLRYCSRPLISQQITKVLNSAIANSENNHSMDIRKLFVDEILVGKSISLKRTMFRARGRTNRIVKPYTRVTVILKQEDE